MNFEKKIQKNPPSKFHFETIYAKLHKKFDYEKFSDQQRLLEAGKSPIFSKGISTEHTNTEAKLCFATHDEDNDYFNMRIYIILIACVYIQQFNFIQ